MLTPLVPHFFDAVTLHGILDLAFAAGLSVMKLRAMRDRAEFCAIFSCQEEAVTSGTPCESRNRFEI